MPQRGFIQTMQAAGRQRFVLSSGCTLAMETPEENLHALINAAKNYGSGPGAPSGASLWG